MRLKYFVEKLFESLLINKRFKYFTENKLLYQISLVLNRVILAQLLFMTLDIYKSFDEELDVRSISLMYQKYLIKCGMMISSSD